jgi:hypothetical protein
MAEVLFPVDGSTAEQKLASPFNFWFAISHSLRRNFPSIWFRAKVIQEFHARVMINFFQFLGANLTLKFSFQVSRPQNALP